MSAARWARRDGDRTAGHACAYSDDGEIFHPPSDASALRRRQHTPGMTCRPNDPSRKDGRVIIAECHPIPAARPPGLSPDSASGWPRVHHAHSGLWSSRWRHARRHANRYPLRLPLRRRRLRSRGARCRNPPRLRVLARRRSRLRPRPYRTFRCRSLFRPGRSTSACPGPRKRRGRRPSSTPGRPTPCAGSIRKWVPASTSATRAGAAAVASTRPTAPRSRWRPRPNTTGG